MLWPQVTKSLPLSVSPSVVGERRAAPGVNPPNSHFSGLSLRHRPIYPGGRLLERSPQKATGAEGSVEDGDGAGLFIFTKRTLGSGY